MNVSLLEGDCLEQMKNIPDGYVDLILCDLPYGSSACKWDTPIDLPSLWAQYKRICKGSIVLTAAQPFTSVLVMSNVKNFKQALVWSKGKGSNPLLARKRIMQSHEDVLVFGGKMKIYNPQMTEGTPYKSPRTGGNRTNSITGKKPDSTGFVQNTKDTSKRFPLSVMNYSMHCGSKIHPTQKPQDLMEYLIRTYTDEDMTVLDNCMGSGTTGLACINTNRHFIGIEKDHTYFEMAKDHIQDRLRKL